MKGWIGMAAAALMLAWIAIPSQPIAAENKAEEAEAKQEAKVEHLAQDKTPSLDPQLKCLALTVYWEGRMESEEGQAAIAHTVLNRSRDSKFPDGICGVITQGDDDGKRGCQFAWWCDGKSDQPDNPEQWATAVDVARAALVDGSPDPTKAGICSDRSCPLP